jgi:hypothetical protein
LHRVSLAAVEDHIPQIVQGLPSSEHVASAMPQQFTAKLTGRGPSSAWVFMPIPFDVAKVFGANGQVFVTGSINGFPFRNSLLPNGDGTHAMPVNKELQAGAGAKAGDIVEVILERDVSERIVEIPMELARSLDAAPEARAFFDSLSYSRRKEYTDWVGGAKQETTRVTRAQKAIGLLLQNKKLR